MLILLTSVAGAGGPGRADAAVANPSCPVMPTERALPDHSAQFGGKTVYFCCQKCVRRFSQDPSAYSARLSGLSQGYETASVVPVPVPAEGPGPLSQLAADARPVLVVMLAVFVANLVAARLTGRGSGEGRTTGAGRRLAAPLGRRSTLLALLVA